MNITQYLQLKQEISVSFEILPPERGKAIGEVYKMLDPLFAFNPVFISIANHQSEKEYSIGCRAKKESDKRPAWLSFAYALKTRYNTKILPHLLCNELTPYEIENTLIGLNYLGIQNVMALRGDKLADTSFHSEPSGKYDHASQIITQVSNLNKGKYLYDVPNGVSTNFCIAVAGYPEKHPEAKDFDTDLYFLKKKVDAGAHFIITQMFYDNSAFTIFVQKCRAFDIPIPILPGLKPIFRKENLDIYWNKFKVTVPTELKQKLQSACDIDKGISVGKEWLLHQCHNLLAGGTKHLHFFIFSSKAAEIVLNVLKEII